MGVKMPFQKISLCIQFVGATLQAHETLIFLKIIPKVTRNVNLAIKCWAIFLNGHSVENLLRSDA